MLDDQATASNRNHQERTMRQSKGVLLSIVSLALGLLLLTPGHSAAQLIPPIISLTVDGNFVTVSWDAVPGAEGYDVYYAPYPDASPIRSYGVGNRTQVSAHAPPGSAYYIGVMAYGGGERSAISNILIFDPNRGPIIAGGAADIIGSWSPTASGQFLWTGTFQFTIHDQAALYYDPTSSETGCAVHGHGSLTWTGDVGGIYGCPEGLHIEAVFGLYVTGAYYHGTFPTMTLTIEERPIYGSGQACGSPLGEEQWPPVTYEASNVAYANGSRTWLQQDGAGGVNIEMVIQNIWFQGSALAPTACLPGQ
jgi:hypothetical protein